MRRYGHYRADPLRGLREACARGGVSSGGAWGPAARGRARAHGPDADRHRYAARSAGAASIMYKIRSNAGAKHMVLVASVIRCRTQNAFK